MKYHFILIGAVCLSFMLLPACALEPVQEAEPVTEQVPSTEDDEAAIEEILGEHYAAANSGDSEKFLALLSTGFEVIPPNQPSMRGDQAKQWIEDFFEQFTIELEYTDQEIVVSGDLAFERYTFEWTVSPKNGGDSVNERGAGIQILQRQQGGTWKVIKDIWNLDEPPPAQD